MVSTRFIALIVLAIACYGYCWMSGAFVPFNTKRHHIYSYKRKSCSISAITSSESRLTFYGRQRADFHRGFYKASLSCSFAVAISTLLKSTLPANAVESTPLAESLFDFKTIEETSRFIRTHCSDMAQVASSTGRLLYRGESQVNGKCISLVSSPCDLLDPATFYNDNNARQRRNKDSIVIADYFKSLGDTMGDVQSTGLRPEFGHLATTSPMDASRWGPVCSIWPLNKLRYSWLKSDLNFWNDDWLAVNPSKADRTFLFWKNKALFRKIVQQNMVCDEELDFALLRGPSSEILFGSELLGCVDDILSELNKTAISQSRLSDIGTLLTASKRCAYVAVPVFWEAKLMASLGIQPYSSVAPIKTLEGNMDLDVDIRTKRRLPKVPVMFGSKLGVYDNDFELRV